MNERWVLLTLAICGFEIKLTEGNASPPTIIGGNDAAEDAWRWQMLLLYKNRFECGGTLLNADTVLTAGHCTYQRRKKFFRVKVGEYNRRKNEKSTRGERRIKVKKIIQHPDYDYVNDTNDLSIIKLERCVKFNKYIKPIHKLADDSMDFINETCYVTGWGVYDDAFRPARILQELQTSVITNVQCQPSVKNNKSITDDMICANADPKGACFGDSGGPLQCRFNQKWVHVGSVSWGSNSKCGVGPTVYARTSFNRDWILNNMK